MLERNCFSTEALAGSSARLAGEEPKRIKIRITSKIERRDGRGRGGIEDLVSGKSGQGRLPIIPLARYFASAMNHVFASSSFVKKSSSSLATFCRPELLGCVPSPPRSSGV